MEALEIALSDYETERGKPMPSFNHSFVQANLIREFGNRLRRTHTVTSETNVLVNGQKTVPDLAIFSHLVPDLQHDIQWVETVPVTTVEILSPKQDLDTLLEKARSFLSAGVKSCWIVLPAVSTVYIFTGPATYRTFADGGTVRDELLDVEIPLVDIFS